MKTRLIYKIGEHLPKWLRVIYYIIIAITFIYIVYRFLEWALKTLQKLGAFIFEPRNYWAAVMSVFIVLLGVFIAAQFILGLDPVGNTIEWIEQVYKNAVGGLLNVGN